MSPVVVKKTAALGTGRSVFQALGIASTKALRQAQELGLLGEKKEGRMDGKEHRKHEVGVKGRNGGMVRNGSLVLLKGCHQG